METYVDCIKGKLTKSKKRDITYSSYFLEIVHANINGLYSSTIYNNKYFITFY